MRARLSSRATSGPARRVVVAGMKENIAALPPSDSVKRVTIKGPSLDVTIDNVPGKKASVRIYSYLASQNQGKITPQAARTGLDLYDEMVQEAKLHPGSHSNIDILLNVVSDDSTLEVVVEH